MARSENVACAHGMMSALTFAFSEISLIEISLDKGANIQERTPNLLRLCSYKANLYIRQADQKGRVNFAN